MTCPFYSKSPPSFWSKFKSCIKKLFSRDLEQAIKNKSFEALVNITVHGIIIADSRGFIKFFNRGAEKLFGYTFAEVSGKNVHILMPEPFQSKHDEYIDRYLRTGEKRIIGIGREVIAKRKDGTVFPIDLAVDEVFGEGQHVFTALIRDLSEIKEAEQIKSKNMRMEAEVHAKNEYISILSHDLRTPLTVIYGALRLLLIEEKLSESSKELIELAHRNTDRLIKIVSDVLDIGKIQSGKLKMELKAFSIIPLIREAISSFQLLANKRKITLIDKLPSEEVLVFANYDRLFQVMLNILSNAIKYSKNGESVIISLEIIQDKVRVSIQDFGSGISDEFREKIFEPFSREDHTDRGIEGTGLGLYICKSILEQLGGKIDFVNNTPKGTTFFFEFTHYKEKS